MEDEKLRFEIKKIREAYAALQLQFDSSNLESTKVMEDNKSLHDNNKILKQQINNVEKEIKEYENEKKILLEAKRTLYENIQQMEEDLFKQNELKANFIKLEKRAIHLQEELNNVKLLNTQYFEENATLNQCLINASKEVEENIQQIEVLQKRQQQVTSQIEKLKYTVHNLTEELEKNTHNRNTMLHILQNNRSLTAENKKYQVELTEILQLNEELESQAAEDKKQIKALQVNLQTSTNRTEKLEKLALENSSEISELITQLAVVEGRLTEATENRNKLSGKYNCLNDQLAKLNGDLNDLNQSYGSANEHLIDTLDQKKQMENELKAITATEQKGDTISDLKLALLTCMITTRNALDKFKNVSEDFVNADVENAKIEAC